MTRKPDDIRLGIDTTLSGASHDPTLFNSVVNASKGDSPPMKRKLTLTMALILVLILMTGTVAAASLSRFTLQDFFDLWFENGYVTPALNTAAVVSPEQQRHTSKLVDLCVEEMYLTDTAFYFTLRITPKDDKTILFPSGSNSTSYNGQTVRYFDLWDTDLTLLQMGPIELDNLNDSLPFTPISYPGFQTATDSNSVTLMCCTYDEKTVKRLNSIGDSTLMIRFYIHDLRGPEREWNTMIIDAPHIEQQPHQLLN